LFLGTVCRSEGGFLDILGVTYSLKGLKHPLNIFYLFNFYTNKRHSIKYYFYKLKFELTLKLRII